MDPAPGAALPVLHAAPHSGDALGIAVLVLVWIVAFVAITGAVLALLAWRYGGGPGEDSDTD